MQRTHHSLAAAALLALIATGCGAQATPTFDVAQIQASAAAAASTMIAETRAAMPTNTAEPPTPLPSPTELPSPVPVDLPTLAALPSPTVASSAGKDDCNHPLDLSVPGPQATVLIRNDTKGQVTFSMGLGSKNFYGQCGYLSWSLPRGQSIMVFVPQTRTNAGDPCYWAAAFVNDPKHPSTPSGGGCLNNPDKWTFDIEYDRIKLTAP